MPEILKQLSRDASNDFPPKLYVKFTQEEFPKFLADPLTTMKDLGYNVESLTVTISSNAWVSGEWVKSNVVKPVEPPAQNWCWLCGYEDEMCVCYTVLC
jgi:hypothetical protein